MLRNSILELKPRALNLIIDEVTLTSIYFHVYDNHYYPYDNNFYVIQEGIFDNYKLYNIFLLQEKEKKKPLLLRFFDFLSSDVDLRVPSNDYKDYKYVFKLDDIYAYKYVDINEDSFLGNGVKIATAKNISDICSKLKNNKIELSDIRYLIYNFLISKLSEVELSTISLYTGPVYDTAARKIDRINDINNIILKLLVEKKELEDDLKGLS